MCRYAKLFPLLLFPDVDTLSGGWVQTFKLLQDTPLSFRWDLERQIISGIPHLEAVQDCGAASSEKYTNMWDKVHARANGNTEFLTLAVASGRVPMVSGTQRVNIYRNVLLYISRRPRRKRLTLV